jgi:hypothetical protein
MTNLNEYDKDEWFDVALAPSQDTLEAERTAREEAESALTAAKVEGMEWCADLVANWKRDHVIPECCDGAQEIALTSCFDAIRAEIERRKS